MYTGIGLLYDTRNKMRDPFAVTVATTFLVLGPLLCLCTCWHMIVVIARVMFLEYQQGKIFFWCLLSCHVIFVAWMVSLSVLSEQFWSEVQKNAIEPNFSMVIGAICFIFQYILAVLCVCEMLVDCARHHRKYF